MEFGINTCFAVKRWPRPADWASVVRDRLGLDLVQLSLDLIDLAGSEATLRRVAADHLAATAAHDIRMDSVFTGLGAYSANLLLHPEEASRDAAQAWFRSAIEFSAMIGATSMGGHVGAFSVPDWADPGRRAALWSELKQRLADLAEDAHRHGLEALLIENLAVRREPSTMADIEELITDGDATHVAIRLCLDVGHMCVTGTTGDDRDPYAWLARLGPRSAVIQLQQSDADGDHHWPFTRSSAALGRIDPARVLEALGPGSTAPLFLEIIPSFEQPDDQVVADLVESVATWRAVLA
jgi:D-erythrulose 1-phosphate 3-epimerase